MSERIDVRMEDWNRLLHEVARLRILVIIALIAVIALAVMSFMRKPDATSKPDPILRAQGLVITDSQGHDRILIGAPVPASKDRMRKDDVSDSIIFLGNTGADRLALGQLPTLHINGKTQKRMGSDDNYGITLYDLKGNERGGMAFIMGTGRVGLALDRAEPPYDAIGMMVDDKSDFAGMYINYSDPKARDSAIELGSDASDAYIKLNGKDGLSRAKLEVDGTSKLKPMWQFDDAESATKAAEKQQDAQTQKH